MAYLDSQQTSLTLTDVPYVLDELRRKRRLVKDERGDEIFKIQFDSRTFEFFPKSNKFKKKNTITVGKTVGDCLVADAFVIVGPPIDGEVTPVLEIVKEFNLAEGESSVTPTTCSFCKREQGTAMDLARHLIAEHTPEGDDDARVTPSHAPARKSKAAVASKDSGSDDSDADAN